MSAGEAAAMAGSGRTCGPPARYLRYGTQCGGYSDCRSRGRPLGPSERDAARPPSLVNLSLLVWERGYVNEAKT